MTGRGRGRARGRSKTTGASQQEPPRRPGTQEQQQQQQQQQAQAPVAPGSGRSSIRGGTRGEPRPGGNSNGESAAATAAAAAVTQQMAQVSLGTGDGMREQRRDRRPRFSDPTTRPAHVQDKRGESGTRIPVVTNYFNLESRPDWHLYQYHVDFDPPIDNRRVRVALLYNHEESTIGFNHSFDGMVLFLPKKLPQEVTEVYSIRKTDDAKVRITIKLTNELPASHPECLHMYNSIFKEVLRFVDMQEIGRQYFNPKLAIQIPRHKLEVWPGFTTAIGQFERNVMLCADISHKILRCDTVLDIMYDIYNNTRGGNFYENCTKKLVGEIVLTRYNNKTYRIDDIHWDLHPDNKFPKRDGTEISYVEYFKTAHDKDVKDLQQPLLVSRAKKRDIRAGQVGDIHLLPEFCTMTGLSEDVRADFHVMKDIAVHTRVAPGDRVNTLNKFINQINTNSDVEKKMGGWGLAFAKNLMQIDGRILPPEKILMAKQAAAYKPSEADWSRETRGMALVSPVNLDNWLLLYTNRDEQVATSFIQTLKRVAGPLGMAVNEPTRCQLANDRVETFLSTIKSTLTPGTKMVICILPSNRKDRYDAIKKMCCVDNPVPSQVIVTRTISKPQMLMSVCTKIAIQLNCKLGGEAWAVDMPLKFTMFIGIDTYHDSSAKGRSVGGVVCSLNKSGTRYYSRVTHQSQHQELIDGLKVAITDALKKYCEVNNQLPDRICVYRDGVGDGQLAAVYEHEVQQILGLCKDLSPDYAPKIIFIVVKKRINTRFFAPTGRNFNNPPPGTVIDDQVTKQEWYDFFLVSQSVKQGTVTPTHYNVLWDTFGLKPDLIQRMTYKMTHLYYNWPGTIRVPAPCQYAHKLAFLVGQSIHRDPSLDLCDKLFFL